MMRYQPKRFEEQMGVMYEITKSIDGKRATKEIIHEYEKNYNVSFRPFVFINRVGVNEKAGKFYFNSEKNCVDVVLKLTFSIRFKCGKYLEYHERPKDNIKSFQIKIGL